jgi:superfamily I DNA and RNA helicase
MSSIKNDTETVPIKQIQRATTQQFRDELVENVEWQRAKEARWKKGIATCNLKGKFL